MRADWRVGVTASGLGAVNAADFLLGLAAAGDAPGLSSFEGRPRLGLRPRLRLLAGLGVLAVATTFFFTSLALSV